MVFEIYTYSQEFKKWNNNVCARIAILVTRIRTSNNGNVSIAVKNTYSASY